MKLLAILLIFFSTTIVFAKEKYITPKVGFSYGYAVEQKNPVFGPGVGGLFGYNLEKNLWCFEMDVAYYHLMVADENKTLFKEIPVQLDSKYRLSQNFALYLGGGVIYTAVSDEKESSESKTKDYLRYRLLAG